MERAKNISIDVPGGFAGTTILVDGQPIENVRSVRFEHVAGDVPVLTLEVLALNGCVIGGLAEVRMPKTSLTAAAMAQHVAELNQHFGGRDYRPPARGGSGASPVDAD